MYLLAIICAGAGAAAVADARGTAPREWTQSLPRNAQTSAMLPATAVSGDGSARPRIEGSRFQSNRLSPCPFLGFFGFGHSMHMSFRSQECEIEIIIHVENTFRSVLSSLNVQIQLAEYGQLKPGRFLVIVAGHVLLNSLQLHKPPGTGVQVADGIHLAMVTGRLLLVWTYPVIAIETV